MAACIDTDYLIVGAGAVGLAFADTILAETDATVTIVDRHGQPGGHWNDAYSFVQLHQPSAFYGVNSVPLGDNLKDSDGLNEGYYELATGPEVSTYFEKVMHQHLLPSGRVTYFPMSDYTGDGRFVSLLSGAETQVNVRRKTVDATFYGTSVPSTHTPSFEIADGVNFATPNALPDLRKADGAQPSEYVILGAGKTAMDVAVWLLESGANPDTISWVTPRDSWMLNRHHTQPGIEFFEETIGGQSAMMEALAKASDLEDLFERLETCGMMIRINPDISPTMYHCATVSISELDLMRQIKRIIRKGRVTALETGAMVLDQARIEMPNDTLYIDCTATAVERRDPVPIFQGDLITPQMVRTCQPAFSAALAAFIEVSFEDDERKNELTRIVPLPDGMPEFLSVTMSNMMNQYQWSQEPVLRDWMLESRLDGFSKVISAAEADNAAQQAILNQFRTYAGAAIANLQTLMGQQVAA